MECVIISECLEGGSVSRPRGRSGECEGGGGRRRRAGLYSPVSGVAGPLTRCPGAAGLQLSAHAGVCAEECQVHLQ